MINSELSKYLGYEDYSVIENYIKNWKPVKELEWLNSYPDRRCVMELTDSNKEVFDTGWKTLKKARPELNITYNDYANNKITINKQQRKLFKYINDQELSEIVGAGKLPNKKLFMVISTNFDDFLMCSTKNNWRSCTEINDGDYKFTTLSNIFTQGRFICYITDMAPTECRGLQSYNKFFRSFGFINGDGLMTTNIWYPVKEYLTIEKTDGKINSVVDNKNKYSKYGFDIVYNSLGSFVYPYLDYSTLKDNKYFFENEYKRYEPEVIFKNGELENYNEYIKFGKEGLKESMWMHCDICGSVEGHVKTLGDKNYCDECSKKALMKCCVCGKMEECLFTEDNTWVGKNCLEKYYGRKDVKTCSCGTLIRKKGEEKCRFCRSDQLDAFKMMDYSYYDGKTKNKYSYFKHHYMKGEELPPGIKMDEPFFEENEMYVRR